MNAPLPEREAIFRFAKIFIGQYLASVRIYPHTKTTSIRSRTKRSTSSLSSSSKVRLTPCSHQIPGSPRESSAESARAHSAQRSPSAGGCRPSWNFQLWSSAAVHTETQGPSYRPQEFGNHRKYFFPEAELGKMLFKNDIESVNNYPKETTNANIRFVPPVFLADLNKVALPYRRSSLVR